MAIELATAEPAEPENLRGVDATLAIRLGDAHAIAQESAQPRIRENGRLRAVAAVPRTQLSGRAACRNKHQRRPAARQHPPALAMRTRRPIRGRCWLWL